MSRSSGSEQRQRRHDVRIRLRDEDEVAQFDQLVSDAGYHGDRARGDWLRSHLPGVIIRPSPPPPPLTFHPWVDAVAAIDALANEIAALPALLERMQTGVLRFDDADRLQATLSETIAQLLVKADRVISELHGRSVAP